MVRRVTVKPLARVTKTAPTSLTIEAIGPYCSKVAGCWQFPLTRFFRPRIHFAFAFTRQGALPVLAPAIFPSPHGGNNLAAVESSVFDEDVGSFQASDNHSGNVDAGDVGFKRIGIDLGASRFGIEANSLLL